MNLISQDYLMHHGVKGMKWGVRRYQNADGSLNRRGRARQEKRDKYISDKERLIKGREKGIANARKYQSMSDTQRYRDIDKNDKDLIKEYMDIGEMSRSDARKQILNERKAEAAKEIRINKYQIQRAKSDIKNIKSTPINKLSVVEASSRRDKVMWGASVAGSAAGVGMSVALRKTGIINTGQMIAYGLGLGAAGFIAGDAVGYSKATKYYKKKGINTSLW